jgi:hypothetical protein
MPQKFVSLPRAEKAHENRWNEPNIAVTDVVRQHVVPRFYLEGFTDADGLVSAIDPATGSTFRGRPEALGFEKRFNDLGTLPNGRAVSTEPWLGELERVAAPVLKTLATVPDAIQRLEPDEQRALARYLAAQSIRVPEFREQQARMQSQLAAKTRPMVKHHAMNTLGMSSEDAEAYIECFAKTDEGWFLNSERDREGEAYIASSMLAEVSGLANLLIVMPWRVGFTEGLLYTSDNPMAGLPPFNDPFGGAFAAQRYYFPLTQQALLVLGPAPGHGDDPRLGFRERRDFGAWETAIARHVVAFRATRFLYGPAPYVSRTCAQGCLIGLHEAKLKVAVRYAGLDPTRPQNRPLSATMRRLVFNNESPRIEEVHDALWDYLNYLVPLSALQRWSDELAFMANQGSCAVRRRELIVDLLFELFSTSPSGNSIRRSAMRLQEDLNADALREHTKRTGASLVQLVHEARVRVHRDSLFGDVR